MIDFNERNLSGGNVFPKAAAVLARWIGTSRSTKKK